MRQTAEVFLQSVFVKRSPQVLQVGQWEPGTCWEFECRYSEPMWRCSCYSLSDLYQLQSWTLVPLRTLWHQLTVRLPVLDWFLIRGYWSIIGQVCGCGAAEVGWLLRQDLNEASWGWMKLVETPHSDYQSSLQLFITGCTRQYHISEGHKAAITINILLIQLYYHTLTC